MITSIAALCWAGVVHFPNDNEGCMLRAFGFIVFFVVQVRVPTFLVPATKKVYDDIQTLKVRSKSDVWHDLNSTAAGSIQGESGNTDGGWNG